MLFQESDLGGIIAEAWSRYTGQPTTMSVGANWRSPGLFGLIQRRRAHLFKLPTADPVLPDVLGEYPHYQSDFLRQKHWEMVARLLENRFTFDCTGAPGRSQDREMADRAEWVLTYGAAQIQERTGVDWQRALAEAASAYCYGILHYRIAPELSTATPNAAYLDAMPEGSDAKRYQKTEESVGGDPSKGKYRETAQSVQERTAIAKSRAAFPIHVEVVAPDQVAFIDDDSGEPGPGMVVWVREVGIIDYNGKLAKEGLRLSSKQDGESIRLVLENIEKTSGVGQERPSPVGGTDMAPSIAGWKQRVALACVWTRGEYYETVAPSMVSGGSEMIVAQAEWVLIKAKKHGYGRCPFVRAYATVEENEWDPALRYRPALDGTYASKSAFDYTRALHDRIATQRGIQKYFIEQDVNAPPTLAGDEEGDSLILTRDSAAAQVLPPGQELKPVATPDMDSAFVRMLEIQTEELKESAPPTGQTPISATSQPWNLRIGQVMANAYPALLLNNISKAIVEMMRNIAEVAAKPAEEGGLGFALVAPGFSKGARGIKQVSRSAKPLTMEPADWEGIWIDVNISPVSSAERVTQIQLGQQLLASPIHVSTPEHFVSDDLGVQDATGYLREVDAFWAIQPFMQGITNQTLSEYYGAKVLVGADGSMANGLGQAVDPNALLAQNGVKAASVPGSDVTGVEPSGAPDNMPSPVMPALPTLSGSGAGPVPGMR